MLKVDEKKMEVPQSVFFPARVPSGLPSSCPRDMDSIDDGETELATKKSWLNPSR